MLKWMVSRRYIGEKVRKPSLARKNIEKGKPELNIYLLTLSSNPHHLLEFFPAFELKQEILAEKCPPIVGMASGRREALSVVMRIIEDVRRDTGGYNVKEYLEKQFADR